MNTYVFPLAAIGAALALSACSSEPGQNTAAESSILVTDGDKGIKLLSVSYDVARDFYKEYNPLSTREYQVKHNGETVDIQQSHGSSSKQALSTAGSLAVDVVTMNQTFDIELLGQEGLIKPGQAKCLPNNVVPYTGTAVFPVRKGNPKQIKSWPDLTRNGVQIVIVNPKITGNGRYAFPGAHGYGLRANSGGESKAKEFAAALLKNVPVLENGGRTAITIFNQHNIGDMLVTFESETNHTSKKLAPNQFEIVCPNYTILSESPVAAVDSAIEERGTRAAAEEHLRYLWSKPVQELAIRLYPRPHDAEVLAVHKTDFPEIETFSPNERFGPQEGIMKKYFSDGSSVDRLSPKK